MGKVEECAEFDLGNVFAWFSDPSHSFFFWRRKIKSPVFGKFT